MTSVGRIHNGTVCAAMLLASLLWGMFPLAVRADNCPRGTTCSGNSGQRSQPAPQPPARAPAPAAPRQPPQQKSQPQSLPQSQSHGPYPQPPPRAPQYPQPYAPPQHAPPYVQQYPQPQRAPQNPPQRAPIVPDRSTPRVPPQLSQQREQQRPSEHGEPAEPPQARTPPTPLKQAVHEQTVHQPPARRDDSPVTAQRRDQQHQDQQHRDQEHRVPLTQSASLITHPGHAGFTAVDHESAHASIVVEQHADRRGRVAVNAYRQVTSPDGRTITRLYADGRRTVETPTFHSTGQLGGPQFVRYHNGLRAAYLPNGHPLYAERFAKVSAPGAGHGRPPMVVERTIYATSIGGHFTALRQPMRRFYSVAPIAGFDTFVYRPRAFDPSLFPLFYAPLAAAIVIGPQCLICPAPAVAFAAPPARYSDPIELLGDMQVADAVADQGFVPPSTGADPSADAGDAPPDAPADNSPDTATGTEPGPPPPAPAEVTAAATDSAASSDDELAKLRARAEALRQQAADKAAAAGAAGDASNTPVESNLTPPTLQQASFKTGVDESAIEILPVPEDVREQIHKQVRLSIAQHANDHPLALTEVMQSGYSRIFLFQIAAPLDTASVVTGDACALGSGDLIAFATADSLQNATAQMKVVATRPGHCLMQDTIDVSVGDLQDMLNTFNERLEGNMRRLQTCLTAKDGCVRT